MSDGTCSKCAEPSVVTVSGVHACAAHVDEVIGEAFTVIRTALYEADIEITHDKE